MKIIELSNVTDDEKRCLRNMIKTLEDGFSMKKITNFQDMHYGFDNGIINILAEGERNLCIIEDNFKNNSISKLQYFEDRVKILGIIKLNLDEEIMDNYINKEMERIKYE